MERLIASRRILIESNCAFLFRRFNSTSLLQCISIMPITYCQGGHLTKFKFDTRIRQKLKHIQFNLSLLKFQAELHTVYTVLSSEVTAWIYLYFKQALFFSVKSNEKKIQIKKKIIKFNSNYIYQTIKINLSYDWYVVIIFICFACSEPMYH